MANWKDTLTGREYPNQGEEFEAFLKKNNLIGRYTKVNHVKLEPQAEVKKVESTKVEPEKVESTKSEKPESTRKKTAAKA